MYDIPENANPQGSTLPLGNGRGAPPPIDPPTHVPTEHLYAPPPTSPPSNRRRRITRRVMLVLLIVCVIFLGLFINRLYQFGSAISTQPPFSTQTNWLGGTQRTNVAILGYGGPGHDGPYLTDSLLVISYLPTQSSTALISVPRDLWVQIPPNSGQHAKLNTAFSYGHDHGGTVAGGDLAAQKVSDVLGISVPYWVSIDFGGFRHLIDSIGGVDVNVATAFNASLSPTYAPARPFAVGTTHMDGATALLFARARYCTPASEASDFARSARQQLLIAAIAHKLQAVTSWPDLPSVMDALQSSVSSNLSLTDLWLMFTKAHFGQAQRIGLTNQNVLTDAQSADGQDILLPQKGDWNLIQQYVQQQLNMGGS